MEKHDGDGPEGLYWKFDVLVMKGVNKAVRAWNWTTGRTRAQLANLILGAAEIVFAAGAICTAYAVDMPIFYFFALSAITLLPANQRRNIRQDRDEMDAARDGTLNLRVEQLKIMHSFLGPLSLCSGQVAFGIDYSIRGTHVKAMLPTMIGICGISFLGIGISCYVMRADVVPPGKSAPARGFEKLKEAVRNGSLQPAPGMAALARESIRGAGAAGRGAARIVLHV